MSDFAFSNFQLSPVRCDLGVEYPTVEHAFQAMKTLERGERERIAALATPGMAKRAGRKVRLRSDWESVKEQLMIDLLRQKFARGSDHAQALLATGDEQLVEWNTWHDRVWGRCTCGRCRGQGRNLLGQALMLIREELRAE